MLGRRKTEDAVVVEDAPTAGAAAGAGATGKGRPTPKRRDAEAANRRPLVSGDRKADRAKAREAQVKQRRLMDEAMQTGDERYLPVQHKGAARRYARDYIDARWTLGEFFLPVALLVVLVMFGGSALGLPLAVVMYAILALYAVVLIAVVEAIVYANMVHRRAVDRFGKPQVRGIRLYTAMRSMQMRRMRMPKPQVERGKPPA